MNHHFWGDVSAWFYTYLAGINVNPTGRDVTNIDIKPYFIDKLSNVKAYYDTPNGRVPVEWSREGNEILLKVNCVTEHHGFIKLTEGYHFEDGTTEMPLNSGEFKLRRDRL